MTKTAIFGVLALSAIGLAMSAAPTADQILAQYYVIQKSLALDSTNGIAGSAAEISKLSRQAAAADQANKAQLEALSAAAAKLNSADLKSARNGFGDLSEKLIAYLKASGAKTNPPYQFYCSMAKKNWLQPDKTTRNPYYGSAMPTCGEIVQFGKAAEQPMEHK